MKLRSGRTTMGTPPSFGFGDGDSDDMNASLWGELQRFIDLSLIYAKLPLAPFFRLRQVCKEWNRLASDRQFLEQNFKSPISNLFFIVTRRKGRRRLWEHRLWTSQDSSWTSSPLPRSRCEVSGLLYEDSDRHRVFDFHTRVFYSLPPLPPRMNMDKGFSVGMTVDTALIPYGFRVFISNDSETNMYDSNSSAGTWDSCLHMYLREIPSLQIPSLQSSVHYNKLLYVLDLDSFEAGCYVHTYDLDKYESDFKVVGVPQTEEWKYGGIGVWRDRWFAFGMSSALSALTVWEMNTDLEEAWTVFDSIPKGFCKWLMRGFGSRNILITFCGEHVLVYNCLETKERAVLYNLERKTWKKVLLAGNARVAVKKGAIRKTRVPK